MRIKTKNKFLIYIYSIVFRKFLYDHRTGKQSKIIEIRGWRTMLISKPWGSRETTTPLFKWLDQKDSPECWRKDE